MIVDPYIKVAIQHYHKMALGIRIGMRWLGVLLVFGIGGVVLNVAEAQVIRSPDLRMQFHRAKTAWETGASLVEVKARVDRVLLGLPNDAEARKLRAQVLLAMDRPYEALRDARIAVSLNRRDGEAQLVASEAAHRSGNRELAEEALDAASELIMKDPHFYVRLSQSAVRLNLLGRAEAFARIAFVQSPREPQGYLQLARVFVLRDQPQEAATILAQGIEADMLDVDRIREDSVLVRVLDQDVLTEYVGQ